MPRTRVRGRARVRGRSDGPVDGRGRQPVQAFVQGPYEPGAVLGAAGGALDRLGEAAGGFAEDDFGEGAAAVVLRQGGGVALDVGGDRAGFAYAGAVLAACVQLACF